MKKLFYLIYAVLFRAYRLFPVKENRISLVSPHNAGFNDSLKLVKEGFEKRGEYDFNFFSSAQLKSFSGLIDFFLKSAFKTATSRFVFLNDNFMPFAGVNFSKKTTVVQLWHGQGAFKKFGLDSDLTGSERKLAKKCGEKYDYIAVSSKNLSKIYASAFGVNEEKIIACGIPENDCFFEEKNKGKFRRDFSIPQNKKIILYAPTFRENAKDGGNILEKFSVETFTKYLNDDYQLAVRLHPQIHKSEREIKGAIDATDYRDVNAVILDSDILITDYSSICMEFAFLHKPCLFYAYDLEEYEKDRGFYFDYNSYVPGKVTRSMDEIIKAIKENDFEEEKTEEFNRKNFDYFDGRSTERLLDFLIEKSKKN